MLTIPVGTVMSRISRGRRMLFDRLSALRPVAIAAKTSRDSEPRLSETPCQTAIRSTRSSRRSSTASSRRPIAESSTPPAASAAVPRAGRAEQAVHALLRRAARRCSQAAEAPPGLRARLRRRWRRGARAGGAAAPRGAARAAWLVRCRARRQRSSLVVGGAFLYQATATVDARAGRRADRRSGKCFRDERRARHARTSGRRSRARWRRGFDWQMHLPEHAGAGRSRAGRLAAVPVRRRQRRAHHVPAQRAAGVVVHAAEKRAAPKSSSTCSAMRPRSGRPATARSCSSRASRAPRSSAWRRSSTARFADNRRRDLESAQRAVVRMRIRWMHRGVRRAGARRCSRWPLPLAVAVGAHRDGPRAPPPVRPTPSRPTSTSR